MSRRIETGVNDVVNTGDGSGATVTPPAYDVEAQESASAMNDGAERQRDAESIPSY